MCNYNIAYVIKYLQYFVIVCCSHYIYYCSLLFVLQNQQDSVESMALQANESTRDKQTQIKKQADVTPEST